MLAMYLKYHKAGLTPTTPVTSIAISPVKMSIGRKSLTNLRSEMILLQDFVDNGPLSGSKAKVGRVRHISAFRSFSGFIIYNY
jgi:hypothetical protein